ncbi:Bcr/CflA family drug resistance efflux transporter [Prosthecochloris sp. ZM]|uniref:multidrug effflux MFS transporter n=1 Tax=unclassified Prosthecochloris TaxID=2632826 RepID=UPI000DF78BE0|nr:MULTISPECIES: multidrug effflux MFS transporter [unclassified Prosthecochloris]NEX12114.1 Bcr/CflA family drug resistance efflux transporter [Prosthecochloris sp.]RDD30746.1 Bcr/CflA family drug resistance efflux transporter [Prosthecochloris sp. ZM]
MNAAVPSREKGFAEFIVLIAMMMSLVALSIDTMLPALPAIINDLDVTKPNSGQLVLSTLFLGMSAGQIVYGPISDTIGRKPAISIGFGIFIAGTLLCLSATTFSAMLGGRFLQGLGAAAPRIITLALVRDKYEGAEMARIMSFVMTIFILVPILAPFTGQVIMSIAGWRGIFAGFLFMATGILCWFLWRQPETLISEKRHPFSLGRIQQSLREIISNPQSIVYTLTSGLIFGAFLGYLNTAQQIFQDQYATGEMFPVYFGMLALPFGMATLLNSKLVRYVSLQRIVALAMTGIALLSTIFLLPLLFSNGQPPFWAILAYLAPIFFAIGILFGNLNALAMEPLGHIAGTGAATVGSLSTLIGMITGTTIGQFYNGTLFPLVYGFLACTLLSLLITQIRK